MIVSPRTAVVDPRLRRPDRLSESERDPGLLWLDKNENLDPELSAVVTGSLAKLSPEVFSTYPEAASLYRKLANWVGVDPKQILIAAGSDGVIRSVFEAYVSPDDPVIITVPTFAMYGVYGKMYGAKTTGLAYRPSNAGPTLGADEIIDAIIERKPKLVCLPNPDSPTGTIFQEFDLRAIIAAAGEAGAIMLIDEAYYHFHAETVVPLIEKFPHLVVARSTGKAWGMAGLRIGYAVASPEVCEILHKVRPMYECSTVGMAALHTMLDHVKEMEESVARLEVGKALFLSRMENLGFRVLHGKGNFMHVAFGVHASAVHNALESVCYYRADFAEPCLKGFSRFSASTPDLILPVIEAIEGATKGNTP